MEFGVVSGHHSNVYSQWLMFLNCAHQLPAAFEKRGGGVRIGKRPTFPFVFQAMRLHIDGCEFQPCTQECYPAM